MHPTKQKNDLMKYWVEDMNGAKLLTLSQNVQIVYVTLPANQNTMFQGKMKKGEDETTSSKPYGRVNKLFGDKHVNAWTSATKIARLNLIMMNKKAHEVKAQCLSHGKGYNELVNIFQATSE